MAPEKLETSIDDDDYECDGDCDYLDSCISCDSMHDGDDLELFDFEDDDWDD